MNALVINEALGRRAGLASNYGSLGNLNSTRDELDQAEAMLSRSRLMGKHVADEPDEIPQRLRWATNWHGILRHEIRGYLTVCCAPLG